MRTLDDHLQQAKKNEQFANRLIQSWDAEFAEWAVVALFYAAAHYGRAYIVHCGAKTITNHPGFESYFRRNWTSSSDVFPHYRRLKDESERARYDCARYTKADVISFRDGYLVPFRSAILAALGR